MKLYVVELISKERHQLHLRVNAKNPADAQREALKRVKQMGWENYEYTVLVVKPA